jgi:uncharacterized protein (TIGR00299 family) protein
MNDNADPHSSFLIPHSSPIAFFDPLSGISGDMALGALLDVGVPARVFSDMLLALPIDNVSIAIEQVEQYGLRGTQVRVTDNDPHPPHRHLSDIHAILRDSDLAPAVREQALAVFTTLAEAEAHVHGTTVERVHFHEVGAVDAIVDVVGTVLGLDRLGVRECYCGPLPLPFGGGLGRSAHGPLPLPGPATLQILAAAQAPTRPRDTDRELVTPTGAALVATLCRFTQPPMHITGVGVGYGARQLPWPNALRLILGRPVEDQSPLSPRAWGEEPGVRGGLMQPIVDELGLEQDTVTLLETNVDDLSPQVIGYTLDRLFAAGALDAWVTPVQMKKGRPALVVSVLAAPATAATLAGVLLRETPTLGVRHQTLERVKARRQVFSLETPYGPIRVKARRLGATWAAQPEYDDCAAAAQASGQPLQTILAAVAAQAAAVVAAWGERGPI